MNNDLISRSALKAEAIEMEIFMPYGGDGSCMGVTVGTIECAPAVDAVPVVRCKECIHTTMSKVNPETIICCRTLMYGTTDPDFFCAHGEKMDAEVEE